MSPVTFAVAWTLTHDFVGSTIIGATSPGAARRAPRRRRREAPARGARRGRPHLEGDPLSDGVAPARCASSPPSGSRATPRLAARTASSRSAPPRTSCCYQDVPFQDASGLRGSRRFEQLVLAELETAHDRLQSQLGLEPPRPIEVVIYDPAVFDAQFAGLFRFQAAGFYHGVIRVRGDTVLDLRLSRTLHHELVHAALDAAMPSTVLPAWLNEGLAEWFEARAAGQRNLTQRELAVLNYYHRQGALFSLAQLSTPSFSAPRPRRGGARLSRVVRHARVPLARLGRARAARARRGDRAHAQSAARAAARLPRRISPSSKRASRPSSASFRRMPSRLARALARRNARRRPVGLRRDAATHGRAARGVVRDVLPAEGQVVIEHDEIPGLMPAMTMSFDVPDRALLATLAPGQTIEFRVEHTRQELPRDRARR